MGTHVTYQPETVVSLEMVPDWSILPLELQV